MGDVGAKLKTRPKIEALLDQTAPAQLRNRFDPRSHRGIIA